jgi:hypothetical protein
MTQEHVPDWDEIKKHLAAPFHSYYVGWKAQATTRDKTRALAVPYVDARTVMDRLDQAVGMGNWSDTYRLISAGDGEFAVECTLTILDVSKADVGTADEHDDGSQASVSKSAYSDALKRAAVRWGIARYLYRVPRQWVGYDAAKKQLTEIPELPGWALPGSERDSSDGSGDNGSNAPTHGRSAQAAEASSSGGNGKNGGEMSLEQARATVLPFGTRDHPEWKGKSLAEVSSLNTELIAWLANEFNPTSKGGTAVQRAARIMVEQVPGVAKAA